MINVRKIIIISIIVMIILGTYFFFIKENMYKGSIDNINIYEEYIETDSNILKKETDEKNKIIVYITGEIKNKGIYELEENSRVSDIIQTAGGLTDKADISNINLAYMLEDGMKIDIPQIGENNKENIDNENLYISKENNNIESPNYSNQNSKNNKININTASQTELENLPGIGKSTAIKIIDYRKEKGKFKSIEELKKVNGIGESKYNKIKELIKV